MNALKNKKLIKTLELIFAIFVVCMVLFSAIEIFIEGLNEYHLDINFLNILKMIGMFILSIGVGILDQIYLVCILLAILLASKSIYQVKLDETDFEKNKNYYRDIVKNYSISVLNYIDKFKLEKKQSYTAKLLELQNKKIIKIEDDQIIVINRPQEIVDIKFIDSIRDNKITMPLSEYETLVISEAKEKDLIEKASALSVFKNKKLITGILIAFVIIIGIAFMIALNSGFQDNFVVIFLIIGLVMIVINIFIVFAVSFIFIYFFKASNERLYQRTKKGQEINKHLDGLKLFMEEFSNINNKESKHLVLWEDYLIYSVMFNINKNIQNEYSKYFDTKSN